MTSRAPGSLFIVSSPSGGGKTTLIRRLIADPPGEPLHFSVSHTTRPRRTGERHGREYYFVTDGAFRRMAARGAFLEHNLVHGRRYGTSRREVLARLRRGEDVVLDIDVQGARDIRKAYPKA
ncbi:MAG TPA: guanylate kinase, partial [Thermoanaerobaculia bacterium]|nr:guanylate kinase [Thermoanaerobaculia bacterium]